jgi:hypothetical protein
VRSVTTRDPHFFRPPSARCSSVRSAPRAPSAHCSSAGRPSRSSRPHWRPSRTSRPHCRPSRPSRPPAARRGPPVRCRGLLQGLPSVYSSSSSSIPAVRRRGRGFLVAAPLSAPLSACYLLGALQHKQQSKQQSIDW